MSKVTGRARFADDLSFHRMLFASTVYSQHPHARIKRIDISRAMDIPEVLAVITPDDVPGSNDVMGGFLVLAGEKVKYVGDGVALVVAESETAARKGRDAVVVDYEPLPPVLSIDDALEPGASPVHEDKEDNIISNSRYQLKKGDLERGFAEADFIVERTYETQFVAHAYIEPEVVIAVPDFNQEFMTIYGSIQNPFSARAAVAAALGWSVGQVKIVQNAVGGTFGGKDECAILNACRAAIASIKTQRPVKISLSREESMVEGPKRHPYRFNFKVGVKKDGSILAMKSELIAQGGAYNNKAQFTNWRASIHATGPYNIPNIETRVFGVYTNTIYGGAMRGFSSPQCIFAQESLMDEIAQELDMDPLELRRKNALSPGHTLPDGQLLGEGGLPAPLPDIIDDTARKFNYSKPAQPQEGPVKKGIGIACGFRGAGLGAEAGADATGAIVTVQSDGSITIVSGLTDNGQGLKVAFSQIVAEVLGVSLDRIVYPTTDTSIIPDGGPTVASRGVIIGGRAMEKAALEVKEKILAVAGEILQLDTEKLTMENEEIFSPDNPEKRVSYMDVVSRAYATGQMLAALSWFSTGVPEFDYETGQGKSYPTYSWGMVITEVEVDTETGLVKVNRALSTHDVGTAINPAAIKGQVYGGYVMGQGMAVLEDIEQANGFVKSKNFDEYLIPTAMDIPDIDVLIVETGDTYGPFGGKSVGEPGTEMAAASVANAIAQATGKRIRNLPCNLERVFLGYNLTRQGTAR